MIGSFEKHEYFKLRGQRVSSFTGYPPMFHAHGELLYVTEGSIRVTVDGHSHTLQAGELSVLFPYLTHSYEDAPDARALILLFDPAEIAFDNTLLNKKPVNPFTDGRKFYEMLDRAITLIRMQKLKTALGYLNAILGELLEILPLTETDHTAGNMTAKILAYCADHFTEDLTINTVAGTLYVSPSYVSKIFAYKLKYSFREYINVLRVNKAKSLLEHTDQRIADIMFLCGFRNQSSFNRIFRNICGMSPKEYKNSVAASR